MCKQYKIPIYSILTGIILTLITGFFPNVFLIGITYWGYLLPWMSRIDYLGAPLEIIWINLLADIIIWSMLIYLALVSVEEEKMKTVKEKAVKIEPVKRKLRRRKR